MEPLNVLYPLKPFSDNYNHILFSQSILFLTFISTLRFLLDVKRCNAGVKLLMRFASKIIDKYNALPEEERDTSSILGHLVRMQVSHESERVADAVGNNYMYHNLSYGILISLSLILSL